MKPKKNDVFDYILPVICGLLTIFISLKLAMSYDNVKDMPNEQGAFDIIAFFNDFIDHIENHIVDIALTESSAKFVIGGLLAFAVVTAYIYTTRHNLITDKEYGTAKWEKLKKFRRLAEKGALARVLKKTKDKNKREILKKQFEGSNVICTQNIAISLYNRELNTHALMIAGSGRGKTRGYVMPNILQANASFVITDPKGEILEKAGTFLEQQGYCVRVLNLEEKIMSHHYNPFVYVHRERKGWEERVMSLVETLILNTDGGEKKNSSDPFWDKAERLFLNALFLVTVDCFPENQRNTETVIKLIEWLQMEEEKDTRRSRLDYFFRLVEKRKGADYTAVRYYNEFRSKATGKTAKSIVMTVVARLTPFYLKEVRNMLSYDEMQLDMVGEKKMAIFVVVPPTDKTFNFIAGMAFTQLFQEINYCALVKHKRDGMRVPVPVRFLLDEFKNTCRIPNFIEILAYARSLGVSISVILQSLSQLKEIYEKEWETVMDNCSALLYFGGLKSETTTKALSDLAGQGTFEKRSTGITEGKNRSSSKNYDRFGRKLIDDSEIAKLEDKKAIVYITGFNAAYDDIYDYENHPNYRYTSDYNCENSYVFKPLSKPNQKDPHGEDISVEDIDSIVNKDTIVVNKNSDEAVQLLKTNLISLHLDDTDEIPFEMSQVEQLKENIKITKSEQERQKYSNDIMLAFIAETENQNTIKIADTVQSLEQLADEITETEPDIDILGSDIDTQIDENLVEIIAKMGEIQSETNTLQDNLVQSDFAEYLSNIEFPQQILELEEISNTE